MILLMIDNYILINDFTIVEFNKELKVITSLYKNLKSKTQELTFTNNTYSDKGKSKFQNILYNGGEIKQTKFNSLIRPNIKNVMNHNINNNQLLTKNFKNNTKVVRHNSLYNEVYSINDGASNKISKQIIIRKTDDDILYPTTKVNKIKSNAKVCGNKKQLKCISIANIIMMKM